MFTHSKTLIQIEREVQINTLRDFKEHIRNSGNPPEGVGWLTHVGNSIDARIEYLTKIQEREK